MSDETPDVIVQEPTTNTESMTNDDMENFFKEAQAEEVNHNNPTNSQEATNEEKSSEKLQHKQSTDGQSESGEQPVEDAELSSEEGREEHSDNKLPSDERHQQSYKVALKEERVRRQEMQREAQELREANKKMSEAFSKLVSAADEEVKPPMPDYDDDPIGHMKAKLDEANQRIEGLTRTEGQIKQGQQDEQNMNQFMNQYTAKANEFAQDNPDFTQAYNHLVTELRDDYVAQGMTPEAAAQRLQQEELRMAGEQMRDGRNPAETLYAMAKRRGYSAKQESAPADKASKGREDMQRMERGRKASVSLNNKGVEPNTRMSLEEIANLSDDNDFDNAWDDVLKQG